MSPNFFSLHENGSKDKLSEEELIKDPIGIDISRISSVTFAADKAGTNLARLLGASWIDS